MMKILKIYFDLLQAKSFMFIHQHIYVVCQTIRCVYQKTETKDVFVAYKLVE